MTRHIVQSISRSSKKAILIPDKVAEGEVVPTPNDGAHAMDVDLPIMEEAGRKASLKLKMIT